MPTTSRRRSSHSRDEMLNSIVRDALERSVACTLPPVRFHIIHESTVPASALPESTASLTSGTLSIIHLSLVPVKYGSICNPVRRNTSSSRPSEIMRSQNGPVLLSCQTIALHRGRPV